MSIRESVDGIYANQELLASQLREIRAHCPHSKYVVAYYSWRVGAMEPRRICKDCDFILTDMPTQEELKEFAKEEEQGRRVLWENNNPGVPFPDTLRVEPWPVYDPSSTTFTVTNNSNVTVFPVRN